jgi:insulysin
MKRKPRNFYKNYFFEIVATTPFMLIMTLITVFSIQAETPAIQNVADASDLRWLNPDLTERNTAKIRLSNGLEIYLISDPLADQSAASMAIQAGSWDDPAEYPGMAHLCEHMLFGGSQKFPDETEFFDLVADHGGQTNAFTASNRTVYMFSSNDEGFEALLERFAHFFIDPLFNFSGIDREMHAVDQEFAKNIENDEWRGYMIFKETGNADHPNARFSIGNSSTLSSIPASELKKWHSRYYTAPRMRLAVYSTQPLDALKEAAQRFFSAIPGTDIPLRDFSSFLSSERQWGHFIHIQSVRERRNLTVTWELPSELAQGNSKSIELVAYALNRGQAFSLHEQLKREGLIDDSLVTASVMDDPEHPILEISLEMTDKGLQKIDDLIFRCFQAIHGLRGNGIPPHLFDEMNVIARYYYQYQPRLEAFLYIWSIGSTILNESLESYPRQNIIASQYDASQIQRVLESLMPEKGIYMIQTNEAPAQPNCFDCKERWTKAAYTIVPIEENRLGIWAQAQPHRDIRIPGPNPFVCSNFQFVVNPDDPKTPTPMLLHEDPLGKAYYCRVAEFNTPESACYLHILTPSINCSAKSRCMTEIYINYLIDRLHPTISAAACAGLQVNLSSDRNQLHCAITGFSEKAPILLQEILKQLAVPPPAPSQFEQYQAKMARDLSNSARELTVFQAKDLASSILYWKEPTKKEELQALQSIHYDEFCAFLRSLFKKTYTEALFAGNLTLKGAESAWLDIRHFLGNAPYEKKDHPPIKVLSLDNQGPYYIREQTGAMGNAAFLVMDFGQFTFEKRAVHEILSTALKEAFFNELRGKQKTGYIAQSDQNEIELRLFQYFLVQSSTHQPEELMHRFEQFLESFAQQLPEIISPSRFATLKQTLAESLMKRFRSLKDKSALWDQLAFRRNGDFAWVEKRLTGYANLSYDAFLNDAQSFLSRINRKRLAILFEGRIESPFAYVPTSPEELKKGNKYFSQSEIDTK